MIGNWLSKLYRKFNKDDRDIQVGEQLHETKVSFVSYKNASEEFKKTIRDNHFSPYLLYDKGGKQHD